MKVLVIDDEEDVRFVLRISLGRLGGMAVIEAIGGEEGIALASEERPDLILLDMNMPGMDGPETFRELQARPETRAIPVVFLTANAPAASAQRMIDGGARAVLLKPFDPTTLARELSAILHR